MFDLERLTQDLECLTCPFVIGDQYHWRSKSVNPVVQEPHHHCLVFLVLDWDRHTVSAEVALDSQYVLVSVCCFGQWSGQIEVYIFSNIPLFSREITSSRPGVRLFVVFLYAPWTTQDDLSDSGPHPGEPYKVLHRQSHDFSPKVSKSEVEICDERYDQFFGDTISFGLDGSLDVGLHQDIQVIQAGLSGERVQFEDWQDLDVGLETGLAEV